MHFVLMMFIVALLIVCAEMMTLISSLRAILNPTGGEKYS
jgi:hypothetical protein